MKSFYRTVSLFVLFFSFSRVSSATNTFIPLTTSKDITGLTWCGSSTSLNYDFGTYGSSGASSLSIFGDADHDGQSAFVSETLSSTVFTASVTVYLEGGCPSAGLSVFPASNIGSFGSNSSSGDRISVRNSCLSFQLASKRQYYSLKNGIQEYYYYGPGDLRTGWYTYVLKYDGPGNVFSGEIHLGKDVNFTSSTSTSPPPLHVLTVSSSTFGELDPGAVTFGSAPVRIGLYADNDNDIITDRNQFSKLRITAGLNGDPPFACIK